MLRERDAMGHHSRLKNKLKEEVRDDHNTRIDNLDDAASNDNTYDDNAHNSNCSSRKPRTTTTTCVAHNGESRNDNDYDSNNNARNDNARDDT